MTTYLPVLDPARRWIARRAPLLATAGLLLVCFLRRPEMFLLPQLWAEDGPVFFVQADVGGPSVIFRPYADYLHLLPRLVAAVAAPLPAGWIPVAYFASSMAALVGVAAALFSPRIDLPWKPALVLVLGLVPQSGETIGNLTNLPWVTALALVWLLIAQDASSERQQATDLLIAAAVSLTGVFSTILAPFFLWRAFHRRTPASAGVAAVVMLAGCWQAWIIAHASPAAAGRELLPATAALQIVGLRTGASVLLPGSLAAQLPRGLLLIAGGLVVAGLLAAGLWPGRHRPSRLMLAGSCLCITAAALYRFRQGDFGALFSVSMGDRYFFLPKILVLWLLICGAAQFHPLRWLPRAGLAAALLATGVSWRYERWRDFHWSAYAPRIDRGERVDAIPLNPAGCKFNYPGRPGGR